MNTSRGAFVLALAIAITTALSGCGESTPPAGVAPTEAVTHEATGIAASGIAAPAITPIVSVNVVKSRSCGCCGLWVDHLRSHDFAVTTQDVDDVSPFKQQAGITPALASCHTAFVDGYVIEGHVPAEDIRRLLQERPDAIGLTVPGMPVGSPGMEVEGRAADAYDVLLIHRDGSTSVFAHHGS